MDQSEITENKAHNFIMNQKSIKHKIKKVKMKATS